MIIRPVLSEYSSYKGNEILPGCDLGILRRFLDANKLKAIEINDQTIETKSFVGVIRVRNMQIEILPKLLAAESANRATILSNLLYMLSYTKELDIKLNSPAILNQVSNPFLEVLIREYAVSLFDCLKKQTPKAYIRHEENNSFMKGKLKVSEHIRYNSVNQARFYCEYDEFSEDNILNRLFLYVTQCLSSITEDSYNKKVLNLIKNYYCDITFTRIDKFKARTIKLFRNQSIFDKPLKLAKMFIEQSTIDMSKNKFENIALMWDMNKLFEEFIAQLFKRFMPEYHPHAQKGKRLLKTDVGKYRNTYVDILLEKPQPIIIDTKYKKFSNIGDFLNADVFQVSTYCLLDNAKTAILLYPQWTKEKLEIPPCKLNTPNGMDEYEIKFKTVNLMQNIKSRIPSIVTELKDMLN